MPDKLNSITSKEIDHFVRNMDWNLLRTYTVIIQEGGITAAANRLCLQQPTVSAALKRLEEFMGTTLIERGHGRFQLTDTGQRLFKYSETIYGTIMRLAQISEHDQLALRGHIRLCAISNVSCSQLDSALGDFFKKAPGVTLSIEVDTTEKILEEIMTGRFTAGLYDGRVPGELEKIFLRSERYGLYCGPSHPLFGCKNVSDDTLRNEAFVTFTGDLKGDQHRGAIADLLARVSLARNVRAVGCNVEEVKRMIITGIGIGLIPTHLVSDDVARGMLWPLPLESTLPVTQLYMIWNPKAPLSEAEHAFCQHMNKHLAAARVHTEL
ncbi:LysR family transcriptional regulator [Parendozoicomonas haliclonae]|uniref:HTH-type transcriptional activator CmpR n=1 Tax=Parendozoicomonas haliclonae TaxID=1960125 RepID=A0A1X7AR77_9GAMM|nr:LysR family transcriptional regulator [Parendozoicomonas haliclonae]SMA50821.1 HTH-type transcriptional activator CmpR [Parendozoicomonas haliclonae]